MIVAGKESQLVAVFTRMLVCFIISGSSSVKELPWKEGVDLSTAYKRLRDLIGQPRRFSVKKQLATFMALNMARTIDTK